MTEPERFQKVRDLFDATAELPVARRLEHLRGLADDDSIVQEVLALCLANDEDSTTHFSKPLSSVLKTAAAPALKAGDTVGVWQIGREIGQGGMGSVYMVERVDGHFTQTAALKLVKGLPRAEALTFFSRERQLLAKLSHPNIARLLDGGTTPGGQPYLVMEYVDGLPIDRFCRERALGVPQVLVLFISACDAVAFAHQQLVVHCDLKPSNLLINRDGRPVLLDFGIARLLDRVEAESDAVNQSASVGNPGTTSAPYTPRYASPEQRERGVVTTVSDIYSLGIMLNELLGAAVAGDVELKAIVAKATHADAAKRYPTIETFAGDIQRYLRHVPVLAMHPSAGYVARKLVQRRWPLLLAGTAFAATVVGFTVKVVIEAERATAAEKTALKERDRAQLAESQALKDRDATQVARNEALQERDRAAQERDRATAAESAAASERNSARRAEALAIRERDRATAAEAAALQTNDFLVSVFDSADPNATASDVPASTLLTRAEARIAQNINRSPQTQAELYAVMGKVRRNMGNPNQAQQNLQRAIEIERKQNRPLVLAQMLAEAALLDLDIYGGKEAQKLAREALALREKHAAPESEAVADSRTTLGKVLLFSKGDLVESGDLIDRGLKARQRIDPASAETAESLLNAARHAVQRMDYPRAVMLFEQSVAIRERIYGPDHPKSLTARSDLASTYRLNGQMNKAAAAFRELLAVRQRLYGRENEITLRSMALLASVLGAQENYREAASLNEEALTIAGKIMGSESIPYTVILNNLALQQSTLGQNALALQSMLRAHSLSKKNYAPTHPAMVLSTRNLGEMLRRAKEFEAARSTLLAALESNYKVHGENHNEVVEVRVHLARVLVDLGRFDDARTQISAVENMPDRIKARQGPNLTQLKARIAAAEMRTDEAMRLFLEAEAEAADSSNTAALRQWIFKLPRLEFMAARGIDPAARAAAAKEVQAKIENIVAPGAEVLDDLRRLQQQ